MRKLQCAGLAALLLSGCTSTPQRPCAVGEESFISEQLYFGTETTGGIVGSQQWEDFLARAVTPRFPRGLSVWPASGQWQGANGAITRESSYVLSLIHPDDAHSEEAVRAIAAEYKARFQQEAVLRIKSRVCASF
ncbi:MAG: DUF3574 domain-containing protein [Steroidobacteraceae bacterium]